MDVCLGQGADLYMAQLMPLPLTISCSSKFRLVLPFWYRLTRVVLDKVKGGYKMVVVVVYTFVPPVIHLPVVAVMSGGSNDQLKLLLMNSIIKKLIF